MDVFWRPTTETRHATPQSWRIANGIGRITIDSRRTTAEGRLAASGWRNTANGFGRAATGFGCITVEAAEPAIGLGCIMVEVGQCTIELGRITVKEWEYINLFREFAVIILTDMLYYAGETV